MFGTRELAQLNSRKAELTAESSAMRGTLLEDWARVQPVVSWVESGISCIGRIAPLYSIALPLLGIWAGRKGSSRLGLWNKIRAGWRLLQAAAAVLKVARVNKS